MTAAAAAIDLAIDTSSISCSCYLVGGVSAIVDESTVGQSTDLNDANDDMMGRMENHALTDLGIPKRIISVFSIFVCYHQ